MSNVHKQLIANCRNGECLYSAVVHIEIAKQLQPSLLSNKSMTEANPPSVPQP